MSLWLTPGEWKRQGRHIELLGHRIFYQDTGQQEKPAIVLLHGFPTASWDWLYLWPKLSQHYRLITLDFLGFGFSDKPDLHRYSIHEQADLVEALLQQLAVETYHVLAHDYGDTVAQELLARENSRQIPCWQSICFLNGGLFPETHRARFIQKLLLSPLGYWVNRLSSERRFCQSLNAVFGESTQLTEKELAAIWELACYNGGEKILYRLIRYMTDRKEHRQRWLDSLINCRVPMALINGSADPVSGKHMVARFREYVGDGHTIVEYPTIGHYPQIEAPDQVYQDYRHFLNGLSV